MGLDLIRYDELVGRHLRLIDAGAEICVLHAKQLYGVPNFETLAADQLEQAEHHLARALGRVREARKVMGEKPRVD